LDEQADPMAKATLAQESRPHACECIAEFWFNGEGMIWS
jgi:hypothetical protein